MCAAAISRRSKSVAPTKSRAALCIQLAPIRVPCGIVSYQASDAPEAQASGYPKTAPCRHRLAQPRQNESPTHLANCLAAKESKAPSWQPRVKASARSCQQGRADEYIPRRPDLCRCGPIFKVPVEFIGTAAASTRNPWAWPRIARPARRSAKSASEGRIARQSPHPATSGAPATRSALFAGRSLVRRLRPAIALAE